MKTKIKLLLGFFLGLIGILLMLFLFLKDHSQNIGQEEFQSLLANASKFEVDENYLYFWNKNKEYRLLKDEKTLMQVKEKYPINTRFSLSWTYVMLFLLLAFILLIVLYFYRKFKSAPSPISSSIPPKQEIKQEIITPSKPSSSVSFQSLAGIKSIKKDLHDFIDYLKHPQKYQKLGLRMPKGVLLVGPPGVGKTMLAKALANEAGVPFFYQSGSSFAQIFVGSGAKRVNELFAQAKACKNAIIFIDEIDSVGKMRGNGRNDERESTLNQLLTEMDGFNDSSNIIIFGATNNADVLDPALVRSGRFDRKLYIDLPSLQERVAIFELYLKNKNHRLDTEALAKDCSGFSGAMIENLINEAGLLMIRKHRDILLEEDIKEAKQRLIFSLKKIPTLNTEQREILGIYQSSKAFYAYMHQIAFEKVALWEEESIWGSEDFLSKTQIFHLLKLYLSGNETLKILKNEPFTCAQDDLKKAKEIACDILQKYGMGENLLQSQPFELLKQAQEELQVFLKTHAQTILNLNILMLQKENLTPMDLREIL